MSNNNESHMEARSVFINQKPGIGQLTELFGPHTLDTNNNRGLSIALEISLYSLFISFIFIMLLLPNQPARIQALFPNTVLTDPIGFVIWVKMILFIASLVPLFWALHQSSKRMKGRLFARRRI